MFNIWEHAVVVFFFFNNVLLNIKNRLPIEIKHSVQILYNAFSSLAFHYVGVLACSALHRSLLFQNECDVSEISRDIYIY